VIREEAVKEKLHDPGLAEPAHVLGPPGNDGFVRSDRREAVGHAGFAKEALEERVFEIRVDFQLPFGELTHMNVVAPGHVPFVSRDFKNGAMGLAEAAAVAFGDFIVNRLVGFIHKKPRL
jgi:hypothetical protein